MPKNIWQCPMGENASSSSCDIQFKIYLYRIISVIINKACVDCIMIHPHVDCWCMDYAAHFRVTLSDVICTAADPASGHCQVADMPSMQHLSEHMQGGASSASYIMEGGMWVGVFWACPSKLQSKVNSNGKDVCTCCKAIIATIYHEMAM